MLKMYPALTGLSWLGSLYRLLALSPQMVAGLGVAVTIAAIAVVALGPSLGLNLGMGGPGVGVGLMAYLSLWMLVFVALRGRDRQTRLVQSALELANRELKRKSTDLSEALRELQRAQVLLAQAEKMSGIGQLARGMAHELNNPLSFIACTDAMRCSSSNEKTNSSGAGD